MEKLFMKKTPSRGSCFRKPVRGSREKSMDNFGWLQTETRPSNVAQWNEMTNFNPRQSYLPGFEGLERVDKVFLESNLEAGAGCLF